jgi:pantoate--beta-alanine ligase
VLAEARRLISAGQTGASAVKDQAAQLLPADRRLRLEYLEIVDPEGMQPVERIEGPVVVAGALWVGSTRLIDNVRVVTK